MTFFTALVFALGVTLPNILLLCLGKVLRIKKTISHEFCSQASALVFQPGLTILFGWAFDLRGIEMGILFLMTATPTAAPATLWQKPWATGTKLMVANIMAIA
ncbi:hypothetical protein, partial [Kingella kingae]|uniref:hypothetical protein n=2 Tax=Kingella kingae TaxID=504 RepID=UPI001E465565